MSTYPVVTDRDRGLSWSAIFGGTFVFLAIEVTFGILGMAVFASAAATGATRGVTGGITIGAGIWGVVVSIIALYFGGRSAAVISRTRDPQIGMYHGLVTFGMAIFSSILISSMVLTGTVADAANPGNLGAGRVAADVAVGGYWLFVALILGLIAAAAGGRHGVAGRALQAVERPVVPEPRKVA